MADLSKKTRFCTICIRKQSYALNFDNKLKDYCDDFCERYTYIKHENDVSVKGLLEDTHYHLVLVYKKNQRLSTRLNELVQYFGFDNPFGIQVDKTISTTNSIQYLIHKNNPEKTKHSIDEIICNYDRLELKAIIDSESDNACTFEFLLEVLMTENNILNVIQRIGLVTYKHYRLVIWDMINGISTLRGRYKNEGRTS